MASRKTVNLTDDDEAALQPFLTQDSDARDQLMRMVGEETITTSDSAALVALARLGAGVVRDRMLERGYADLAAAWTEEDEAWARERESRTR